MVDILGKDQLLESVLTLIIVSVRKGGAFTQNR